MTKSSSVQRLSTAWTTGCSNPGSVQGIFAIMSRPEYEVHSNPNQVRSGGKFLTKVDQTLLTYKND